jgi:hypothetical protein
MIPNFSKDPNNLIHIESQKQLQELKK